MTSLSLSHTDIAGLSRRFGSPLFVVNESVMRQTFRDFSHAFAMPDFPVHVAFSYKTNYLPAICAILRDEGAWAEVVSGLEYRLARRLGTAPGEIVFNGPWKTRDELETALAEGACVVLDGFDELAAVKSVAGSLNLDPDRPARLGLRLAFDNDGGGPHDDTPRDGGKEAQEAPRYVDARNTSGLKTDWSRFGFAPDDAARVLEQIAGNPGLSLHMLHSHCGTNLGDPDIYARAAGRLTQLAAQAAALGLTPALLDLGGGFPCGVDMAPYATAITDSLRSLALTFPTPPALVLEPGRALVDPAMQLVCTVVAVKHTPGRGRAIILDGGRNLLSPACRHTPRPLSAIGTDDSSQTVQPPPSSHSPAVVFGPLCMPEDMLNDSALLPPLAPGDVVLVHEAGAYTVTQSMPFIRPGAGVVLLGPDGPVLIRREETDDDLFTRDVLPPHLKGV